MDYQRIYDAFIADRQRKGRPSGYVELHHIVPRSLGGSDDPGNLIALSARDHYFAHCCLAKIYGGVMWNALALMTRTQKTTHGAQPFCMGRMFAVSREKAAEENGKRMKLLWDSGQFKRDRIYGPTSEKQKAAARATGKAIRPTKAAEIARAVATRQATAPRYVFVELATGREFEGTALEFRRHTGISQSHVSLLVRGKAGVAKGWVLKGNEGKPRGNKDHTVRVFRHRDGRVFEGTAYEFNKLHINDSGMLSNCINGKNGVKSARGWVYVGEK